MSKPYIVLVTGSRYWDDSEFILEKFRKLEKKVLENSPKDGFLLLSGGARGADMLAEEAAESLGWSVRVFPADWEGLGKRAGIVRNLEMVKKGPDVCLAFPIGESRGTRHCVQAARDAGVKVYVFEG